jgi:hypothetical protein
MELIKDGVPEFERICQVKLSCEEATEPSQQKHLKFNIYQFQVPEQLNIHNLQLNVLDL